MIAHPVTIMAQMMTDEQHSDPEPHPDGMPRRSALRGYGLLAAAVLFAAGVFGFYIATAGHGSGPSPERTVRAFYEAFARGDEAATAFVDRDSGVSARRIAFASSAFGPGERDPLAVSGLTTRLINNEAGWATVRAAGTFSGGLNGERAFEETIFLRRSGTGWLISTEARFFAAFAGPQGSPPPQRTDTGPLVSARPAIGEPAPDFALVDARDGETVRKLSDFKGKAVVVNWYASWCGPCKRELPEFQAAFTALGSEVVFLAVDYKESREKALSILDDRGVTYPALLDSGGAVAEHYRVGSGLPSTFFVDKDGVLRAFQVGQVSQDQLVEYLSRVGVHYQPK